MWIRRLLIAAAALLVGGALVVWAMMNWSYSSGERAGWVQKLSNKGWLCKTWEGELALVSLPGSTPEMFAFTIRDDAVAAQVSRVMGKRVSLHYEQKVGLPTSCFGDTRYYVTALTLSDEIPLGAGVMVPVPPAAPPRGVGRSTLGTAMEVKLDKRYEIDAGADAAWRVLSDVRAVAACMPGAQITEQRDATHYKGTVKSKVGPAVMSFNGDIEVLALEPATRSMTMLGKGADKAGSSASMNLAARIESGNGASASVLAGTATIVVSGKLAQFGSRLLVPVSDAMLKQFADNFRAAVAALPAATAQPAAAAAAPQPAGDAAAAAALPSPSAPPLPPQLQQPVKELNVMALGWSVVKSWFAGLFGRKT